MRQKTFLTRFSILALLLVGLQLPGCSLTRTIEREHPPIGEFVSVDGVRLHYLDTGSSTEPDHKPVVVLLHGASTSLLDFQPNLIASLRPDFRVLAFDRPGLGYSDRNSTWMTPAEQASMIIKGLDKLGVERTVWIGHSWAGSVVLAAMLDHPDSVTAGILIAGASHPWESGVSWHVSLSNTPVVGWMFNHLVVPIAGPGSLESAVRNVFKPNPVPEAYIQATGVRLSLRPETFANNSKDVYCLSDWLHTQAPRYSDLFQPLLLITGTADDVVPSWNHAARLAKEVPAVEWKKLEGAGHALHHSHTEEIVPLVRQFLIKQHPN